MRKYKSQKIAKNLRKIAIIVFFFLKSAGNCKDSKDQNCQKMREISKVKIFQKKSAENCKNPNLSDKKNAGN